MDDGGLARILLTISALLGQDVVSSPWFHPPRPLKVPVPHHGKLTARILGSSLATLGLGVVVAESPVGAAPAPKTASTVVVGTPLPAGWEACVLDGVDAPSTADNVADLDQWQVAEGGSTNNAAAYNPFNTRQVTDSTGAPLPADISTQGFPAFSTWAAGCAATVATLLRPDMIPIVTALQAGNVSPPGIFLSDVDQTPWCAPSVDGIPCYASEVLAGELVLALLTGGSGPLSDALTGYSDTSTDLSDYQAAVYVNATDQGILTTKTQQLTLAQSQVSAARRALEAKTSALRRLAIDDYMNGQTVSSNMKVLLFEPEGDHDALTQFFRSVAGNLLVGDYDQAKATLRMSVNRRLAASESVSQARSVLASAQAAENQDLSQLQGDAKSIETAKACTATPVITPAASSVGGPETPSQLWDTLQDCLAPTPMESQPSPGPLPS